MFGMTLITGVEPDEIGGLDRVYVGPRWEWVYALVPAGSVHLGPQHTVVRLPEDVALYQDVVRQAEARAAAQAAWSD